MNMLSIDGTWSLLCPDCDKAVLHVSAGNAAAAHGGYWLDDGDCVPGVLDNEQDTSGPAHDPMLFVGACWSCSAPYYVIEGRWIAASREAAGHHLYDPDHDLQARYFRMQNDVSSDTALPQAWLLCEQSTPVGLLHSHTFGPFGIADTRGVVGAQGVSACGSNGGARAPAWEHARQVLNAARVRARELLAARVHTESPQELA